MLENEKHTFIFFYGHISFDGCVYQSVFKEATVTERCALIRRVLLSSFLILLEPHQLCVLFPHVLELEHLQLRSTWRRANSPEMVGAVTSLTATLNTSKAVKHFVNSEVDTCSAGEFLMIKAVKVIKKSYFWYF